MSEIRLLQAIKKIKDKIEKLDSETIKKVYIDKKGHLIIELKNKEKIDLGIVKEKPLDVKPLIGKDGKDGISIVNVEIINEHLIVSLSNGQQIDAGSVGGGTSSTNYEDLSNKPKINNVELVGNKSLHDLGIDIPSLDGYATEQWVENKHYLTEHQSLDGYATEDWVEEQGYLTEHQSLDGYATEQWVEEQDYLTQEDLPTVPTKLSELTNDANFVQDANYVHTDNNFDNTAVNKLNNNTQNIANLTTNKYDKTGGEITGNVKVDGTFTLDIEDEDYDAGITFDKRLDDNLGTVLTLTGYANGESPTSYKPIIRNIGTPNSNYDVANKKYVDDNVVLPTYYLTFLNPDGTIDTVSSTLNYNTVLGNLSSPKEADYLDIFWGDTRFYAKCIETTNVNNGDLKFIGEVEYQGIQRYMVFTLTPSNVLTTTNIITFESVSNKVQSVVSNSTSTTYYPSTKAVYDEFTRKPVVIWESSTPSEYLKAVQTNLSASPSWQLTNLDMTPFKRIKIYSCAGQSTGSTASASTTPAMILEMSLDSRNAISAYGGNYVASTMVQKPNDANRLATLTCAVSADKTSFVVLRQTNLYGTAATSNNDVNANVFMIEGYYD